MEQAFRLMVGSAPQECDNIAIAVFNIAYISTVLRQGAQCKLKIVREPMVLEAAARHTSKFYHNFTVDLVKRAQGDESAMGNAFEYVMAVRVIGPMIPSGASFTLDLAP